MVGMIDVLDSLAYQKHHVGGEQQAASHNSSKMNGCTVEETP